MFVNGTGLRLVHICLHGWTFNTFFIYTNLNIKGVVQVSVYVDNFVWYTFISFKLFKLSLSCISFDFFLNFRQSIFSICFQPSFSFRSLRYICLLPIVNIFVCTIKHFYNIQQCWIDRILTKYKQFQDIFLFEFCLIAFSLFDRLIWKR